MARFRFDFRTLLTDRKVHPVVSRRTLAALRIADGADAAGAEADDLADTAQGPGWFDSSWELVRGLDVREGLPANASLNEWLTVCLAEL